MGWWKADPQDGRTSSLSPSGVSPSGASPSPRQAPPQPPAISSTSNAQSSLSTCPVDPRTREIWLQQSLAGQQQGTAPVPPSATNTRPLPAPSDAFAASPTAQCSSDTISQPSRSPLHSQTRSSPSSSATDRSLSHDRVVSSIPRAFPQSDDTSSTPTSTSPPSSPPSNAESETGTHESGNWIYPSQHQFFTAVLRKHNPDSLLSNPASSLAAAATAPRKKKDAGTALATESLLAQTIPSIIPIHNAVNERAWTLIRAWESPFYNNINNNNNNNNKKKNNTTKNKKKKKKNAKSSPLPCTGPKLLSFRGLGSAPATSPPTSGLSGLVSDYINLMDPTNVLTPRARLNGFLGYQLPFDRHEWTVQRCDGSTVDYVIDFYQGRAGTGRGSGVGGQLGGKGGGGGEGEGEGGVGKSEGARSVVATTTTTTTTNAGGGNAQTLNFYLDVRPKLNTWQGWKTRGVGFKDWVVAAVLPDS